MKSSREQTKSRLMKLAEAVFGELLDWSDATPEPNLTQIEDMVLKLRRRLGEEMALEVINAQGDAVQRAKRSDVRKLGR